ncbi:programmed cell death protein 2-like [Montipora capricornis]|uniref:programmed cell death protein 2-like n=1 Tax=Montipora capricornis TaxID=246305 RepID=UPI0035F13911
MATCSEAKQRRVEKEVELGFTEEINNDDAIVKLRMTSTFFPSKIGGIPAWLNLENLPDSKRMLCKICQKPMAFLLQVYAPMAHDRSFHRSIFIFCCKDGKCHAQNSSGCFLVIRNQLKRENKFYSFHPPPDLDEMRELSLESISDEFKPKAWTDLCDVCGCRGDKMCAKCHMAQYCGKEHQAIDWKSGHKGICTQLLCAEEEFSQNHSFEGNYTKQRSKVLFPEYELVTETEPDEDKNDDKSEEEKIDEYKDFIQRNTGLTGTYSDDKGLESLAYLGKEALIADRQFRKFKKRVAREPKQVLRYHKNGEPLWVSDDGKPSDGDIPACDCGSKRFFEFQVMPQMLNHLHVDSFEDSVDWGTLAIYTCSQSCGNGSAYLTEFLWKQNFADTGIPTTALGI